MVRHRREPVSKRGPTSRSGEARRSFRELWLLLWIAVLGVIYVLQTRNSPFAAEWRGSSRTRPAVWSTDGAYLESRLENFSIEIFAAPKPFLGPDKESQNRAIRSWLMLEPKPRITLLGSEVGYLEAAARFGLNLDTCIDRTFLGVPLFNAMVARANGSDATVAIIVNADIILTGRTVETLRKTVAHFEDFLLVSARFDVNDLPPYSVDDDEFADAVTRHALMSGTLHTYGGMDLWAWNTGGARLYDPTMPHFVFGRGKYDNWLTHETIAAGRRQVVDGSETCVMVHVRHDYHLVSGAANRLPSRRLLGQFWSEGKKQKFEQFLNIHMSLSAGTYRNQWGTVHFAPWKISACLEDSGMCLVKRKRPGVCNCEYSPGFSATQTDPVVRPGTRVIQCGSTSVESPEEFAVHARPPAGTVGKLSFGLPLLLEPLLETVARNGTVVVTALNYSYRKLMINWVCNLRRLNVSNFVVAALDEELYKWAVVRGVPVYYEDSVADETDLDRTVATPHSSASIKLLKKFRSRVALRLLKLGFNVLWSDCDVVWFKNPESDLLGYDAELVMQSGASDGEPAAALRRLNAGFYLARSRERTIRALSDVVKCARKGSAGEAQCFYDVICGPNGETVVGDSRCMSRDINLVVLDRSRYPNGNTLNLWSYSAGEIQGRHPELIVLHNDLTEDIDEKWDRLQRQGLAFFDPHDELCAYS